MLNVSIVRYKNTLSEITSLIQTLKKSDIISEIFVMDNSPEKLDNTESLGITYIYLPHNPGYGTAHNIALKKSIEQNIKYHLVINPDIEFNPDILKIISCFMDKNAKIGHLMPKVYYPDGKIQYLCKLLPTPTDLFIRRFVPASWTKKRTDRFELRAFGYDQLMDVPYLSGCFMFLRVEVLKEVGIFDERFFMYPEDIDLTRRIHEKYRTVFYPDVSIIHHHAKNSYKSAKMMWIHIVNLIKYFNKWGWFFDLDRRKINRKTIQNLIK
jgi:GT2 family glycosyltransferase